MTPKSRVHAVKTNENPSESAWRGSLVTGGAEEAGPSPGGECPPAPQVPGSFPSHTVWSVSSTSRSLTIYTNSDYSSGRQIQLEVWGQALESEFWVRIQILPPGLETLGKQVQFSEPQPPGCRVRVPLPSGAPG